MEGSAAEALREFPLGNSRTTTSNTRDFRQLMLELLPPCQP